MSVYEFIVENIDKTCRTYTQPPKGKRSLIGLPYPFTSPCIDGMFQEMYYWDTYFTNEGLFLLGKGEQAVNNVRNFLYLLEEYGKILNGNRMYYISRSQPPFLGLMLESILKNSKAITIETAFAGLEKEYFFWQSQRIAPNRLNRYGCDLEETELARPLHVTGYRKRTGQKVKYTVENARNILCECESGWDFSPRFSLRCFSHNAVDLNSLLYKDEVLLSAWAKQLGLMEKAEKYALAAQERKQKMQDCMRVDGVYYDYDFEKQACSCVLSCASLFPYFVGLDDDKSTFLRVLKRLERTYGLVACDCQEQGYQWSAPNAWAPLNYVAFSSALRLGLKEDAKRIAQKYLSATDALFEKTGKLWEKYNAQTGELDACSEYGTPAMLGWSAGVYAVFFDFLKSQDS